MRHPRVLLFDFEEGSRRIRRAQPPLCPEPAQTPSRRMTKVCSAPLFEFSNTEAVPNSAWPLQNLRSTSAAIGIFRHLRGEMIDCSPYGYPLNVIRITRTNFHSFGRSFSLLVPFIMSNLPLEPDFPHHLSDCILSLGIRELSLEFFSQGLDSSL